jgi:hypothetical protein
MAIRKRLKSNAQWKLALARFRELTSFRERNAASPGSTSDDSSWLAVGAFGAVAEHIASLDDPRFAC